MSPGGDERFHVRVLGRRRLASKTFEILLERPAGFDFAPGQKITLTRGDLRRDYSLVGTADEKRLTICIREIPDGAFSPLLARARVGDRFDMTPAFGQFLFRPDNRPAIWVATGTGVAPFVSYARSGVAGFLLLHGVHTPEECYYREELAARARAYVACIPNIATAGRKDLFSGRVTHYLDSHLDPSDYDFYLCGRREMIRDATRIIDRRFPRARIFTEVFF